MLIAGVIVKTYPLEQSKCICLTFLHVDVMMVLI